MDHLPLPALAHLAGALIMMTILATIFGRLKGWAITAGAALAVVGAAFFYGRQKGSAAERKNTDLVRAQAEADKLRQVAADAKADAAANQAVADAAAQRKRIEDETAAMKPGEAQKQLQDTWSRD